MILGTYEHNHWELMIMALGIFNIHHSEHDIGNWGIHRWKHKCKFFYVQNETNMSNFNKIHHSKFGIKYVKIDINCQRVMYCHVSIQTFVVITKSFVWYNIASLSKNVQYSS